MWTYTTHGSKAYVGGGNGMTAISTDTTGSITVPSKIAGKTVTSVAYGAFQNCLAITNVVLPASHRFPILLLQDVPHYRKSSFPKVCRQLEVMLFRDVVNYVE